MARPYLQRVEETFSEEAAVPGSVRCTIAGITFKQWTWLEPILRLLIENVPLGGGPAPK